MRHFKTSPSFNARARRRGDENARLLPSTSLNLFHPAVADWFSTHFASPTPAQAEVWPAIKQGHDALIAAPTGSGKTLAAFLAAIDDLVRLGLEGRLTDTTQIVYVSPLKALSNDIHRNLEAPLAGVRAELARLGLPDVEIRAWVRTGDTAVTERARMRRRPPHIVVTTPESLYVLLGSESGRKMLATTRSVIVDEIHALAPNKRGAHLALSLERLAALCGDKLQRVGLSATQNPVETVAHFLVGAGASAHAPKIVDTGHQRARDLDIEVPDSPLEAVMSGEVWSQVYDRLARLIEAHETTLVFVNTRRMAERVAHALSERLDERVVTAHHGSMSKEHRLSAEQRLKRGELKALVATASLELGIDIGDVDLVCQLASPRSIAGFLQRVGRSGHAIGGTPKGRLFPLSRDDLVECAALLDSVRHGELDRLTIPERPLDVLAQQIVAEVSAQDWPETALYELVRRAWPFRQLARKDFDAVVQMLADGFATRLGRRGALLHRDAVNQMLRARRGARTTALTSGGTIPDNADYQVVLEPETQVIGSVNEDFAVESMQGDVFQLGNASYRIQRVERGTVRVEDAHGQPPTIPFWLGEAPGRANELSASVSRLRAEVEERLHADPSGAKARSWLVETVGVAAPAAEQLLEYLAAGLAVFGRLPTQQAVVLERFFDEAGGMQMVIHAPFGSRINRAWGLALRKRFCRKFNFELQAAATEDNIVLSLTTAHSFDLGDAARYVHSASVRPLLVQALLSAPMFTARWRWAAGVALALPRFRNGRKVPPQILRMQAEDLIAAVFPDQIACAENLAGEREIPDHPLTNQAIDDCLREAMDVDGLERLLARLENGEIQVIARDLTEPSPLALEALSARPYAFLDDAPLEERRTQAVMARRWQDPQSASDLGRLDTEAIAKVRAEAWPDPVNAEELHDALLWLGALTEAEAQTGPGWADWLVALAQEKRVARLEAPGHALWIPAERLTQFQALWPQARLRPDIAPPRDQPQVIWAPEQALIEILRGRLEGLGPVTPTELATPLGLEPAAIAGALAALEAEGAILRGRFSPGVNDEQWCDRRLLARIHHSTIRRLRSEIEPVAARDFLRFLFAWQHVTEETRLEGPEALPVALAALEGFEAPARAWETEILPARLTGYQASWLDGQCLAGRTAWSRLTPPSQVEGRARGTAPLRSTPIALLDRRRAALWMALAPLADASLASSRARAALDCLAAQGALFFDELAEAAHLLRPQAEEALAELAALGLATSDSFGGLRALLVPSSQRQPLNGARRRGRVLPFGMESGGRWSLVRRARFDPADGQAKAAAVEEVARTLLRRYGVVFFRLLGREASWLPPWRDLLRVFRRLEARGEIRGGRFVAGFSGEQYALPEAVGLLRELRRNPPRDQWVSLSAADPLNLIGILTPGPRLPALTANRVVFRDGLAVATLSGGKPQFLAELDNADRWRAEKRLVRSAARGMLADLA
ncbi:MAG: DEAD/DEAH box helicase [Rhodoblastus sp.]|uniref:DEAD/DEAH box helicase n=1 Tax=Rhodoblastus sp. TaxID=1962975 RepID=UPI003F9C3582